MASKKYLLLAGSIFCLLASIGSHVKMGTSYDVKDSQLFLEKDASAY